MGCGNSKKSTCGNSKANAECVFFEGTLPEFSTLEECVTLEETTQELYAKVQELITLTDMSGLSSECFSIEEDRIGVVTIKTAFETILHQLEGILCPETPAELTQDINLSGYGLNYKCLINSCNESITKLSELLQALIDKACESESTPQVLINTGVISLTTKITHIQTTSASTSTLAAGFEGQTKMIIMTVDGGNQVLGVPTLAGGTTITFDAIDDFVYLMFTAAKWRVITNSNCVIA